MFQTFCDELGVSAVLPGLAELCSTPHASSRRARRSLTFFKNKSALPTSFRGLSRAATFSHRLLDAKTGLPDTNPNRLPLAKIVPPIQPGYLPALAKLRPSDSSARSRPSSSGSEALPLVVVLELVPAGVALPSCRGARRLHATPLS